MKVELYQLCVEFVENRIALFSGAINDAQEGANSQTKSSAGDKHETGRAMAQLETEKNAQQLMEAKKLRAVLSQIDPKKLTETIELGSLVETSNGWFYIAISAGKLVHEGTMVFAVSPTSPIGRELLGKKKGDQLKFNGRPIAIKIVS